MNEERGKVTVYHVSIRSIIFTGQSCKKSRRKSQYTLTQKYQNKNNYQVHCRRQTIKAIHSVGNLINLSI